MTTKQVLGFIGLGAMGLPMAERLSENGFRIHTTVHSNGAPAEALAAKGAVIHPTAADVFANCAWVVTILPADEQIEEVVLSENVLRHVHEKTVLLEMTSGSPKAIRKVAETFAAKGGRVLDAPVSGGTIGAANGTLTVMAGGEQALIGFLKPVLRQIAAKVIHTGEIGSGKAVKAINQMLAAVHMTAASEAIALADKLGIDRAVLRQVVGGSSGNSWIFANKSDAVYDRAFEPGFKLRLMKKDVDIALDAAGKLPLPLAASARELFESALAEDGELDFAAISKHIGVKTKRA
ncbi:NAD(P)-dependent oxidoreductase [Cohnella cellulosilytica]|uniref:NAD(P)-dependent oxidoreductase n=1 Tax=Cohnella cellulosilytica TaxID=986710 RepID=A0ABW2F3J9_9BACL